MQLVYPLMEFTIPFKLHLKWQILCLKFRISIWLVLLRITLLILLNFFKYILFILPVLISVAFITLLERKILGMVGFRLGPNKTSFSGILQPISDALKLSNKQVNLLSNFSFFFYYLSAFLIFSSTIIIWQCVSSEPSSVSLKYRVLIFMLVLGLNSLNSILAGWSVFSKFSLMGRLRTIAQLISYEPLIYLCLFFFLVLSYSFSFSCLNFVNAFFFVIIVPICFYIWIPSFLAELNRTPYDFSEGESELVRGFNTEFGSSSFTFIFLTEYSNIIFFSFLSSFLFFIGFVYFYFFLIFVYIIWIRSVLPRFRFDKLMTLSWKFYIPFLTLFFLIYLMVLL